MKQLSLIVIVALTMSLWGCKKQDEIAKTQELPETDILATQTVVMTPADVCDPVLDDTDEDYRYYCAYYQLADAIRSCMTDNILQYIYTEQLNKINNPSELESSAIYYEDLFIQFPSLEASMNTYLFETDYSDLTYEYDDFTSLASAFVWQGVEEAPAIWIPNISDLPAGYTPVATDYVIATPIQIDLEDLDSEDRIFAWEYTQGVPNTVSIGSSCAVGLATQSSGQAAAKGTFVTGSTMKKGPGFDPKPPYINNQPPYTTSVPSGGNAKINRVRIDQRYERNKKSEIKLLAMSGNYAGTSVYSNIFRDVAVIHKNDVNKDIWIAPVQLCQYISNTDDLVYVYNLYEHDWFITADNWSVGGIYNTSSNTWQQKMWMRAEHSNEYYMCDKWANHQRNLNARIAHPVCYTIFTNGSILQTGKSTAQALISNY